MGPAAYLVPDTYLVKQVMDEADQLGLAVTDNPRNHQFRAGNAILVCTFEKMVNGRTVFGLAGPPSRSVWEPSSLMTPTRRSRPRGSSSPSTCPIQPSHLRAGLGPVRVTRSTWAVQSLVVMGALGERSRPLVRAASTEARVMT